MPVRVEVDEELRSHFKITYDNRQATEVSWSFIRELPPKPGKKGPLIPVLPVSIRDDDFAPPGHFGR